MRQVLEDTTTNPSEKSAALQRTLAPAVWNELVEEEETLVPMSTLNSGSSMSMSGGVARTTAVPKPKGKSRAKATGSACLEATRQRTRTTRELKQVEGLLKRATGAGNAVLLDAKSSDEASLVLLKSRMELLEQACSTSRDVALCGQLFEACLRDPYLKDLQATLLASKDGVQTLGYVAHVRETLLDLQPNAEKVNILMDHQRNAFQVLTKIANCVLTEVDAWRSTVHALIKARKDEAEALRKAEEKERKAEEKREERNAAKEKAKAEKQKQKEMAAELAKAADAEAEKEDGEHQDGTDGRKARRVRIKIDDLDDTDPSVLRTFKGSSAIDPPTITENLNEFLNHVCSSPFLPAVVRFRKASIKKVLQVSCLLVDQNLKFVFVW